MHISREWLQKYFDAELPSAEKLGDALTFHAFEIESIEGDILDVKVTPNRGHDALSHRGIAKELSAILQIPFKTEVDPFAKKPDFSKKTDAVQIKIEDPALCRRYIAGYVKGVKVGPSPDWLKNSLEAIGQRSINNIVDATNLVMFNIGQPLHAFDAAKLGSLSIGVRRARDGEVLEALDDKTYTLKNTMLVITAGDTAIGIAGVKGGKPTGIDEKTIDIVIEAANFDGPTTRKTAAVLKLATDASQRFQQEIAPELAAYGMQQVVDLIAAVAGGEVVGFADVYPSPQVQKQISLSVSKISKVLGTEVTVADAVSVLEKLGLSPNCQGDILTISPPIERLDLQIAEDVIEEVGRMIGYEKIPSKELPAFEKQPEVNQNFAAAERVREELAGQGYSEVFTSVFVDKGEVGVLNKVDGAKPFLRSTLTDGLTDALKKNIPNKDLLGLKEIKLFEIGTVWKSGKEEVMVGQVGEKEKVSEKSLSEFVKEVNLYDNLPLSTTNRYEPFSKYPSITRDVAFWCPKGTDEKEVATLISDHAGDLLVREPQIFDRFEKGEKQSYAFRLVFQSFDRTLFDEDANHRMESVYSVLKEKGYEIR